MKKTNDATKRWPKLSSRELADATRAFDDPDYLPPPVKMQAALRVRHGKALAALRAKARTDAATAKGRATRVEIALEPKLLKRADALAAREGLSLSQIISRGLSLLFAG